MSRLNKELGLLQGIALLSTSLLGTGIFVVPALAATAAGSASLWAWLILIALVLPVAFTFAQLGRHFPHAGGAPHLIGRAFGPRMERLIAFLFLAVLPVGLPAALNIATGFWQALLPIGKGGALMIQFLTLGAMFLLGQRPARASGLVQGLIALAILSTVGLVWWVGDLPRVRDALGVAGLKSALLKGRSNYLCRYRLNQAKGDPQALRTTFTSREQVDQFQRIVAWGGRTKFGDMAELAALPDDSPLLPLVTSTIDNCLGSECPFWEDCFVVQARQRAQSADIVVVNHHLLLADLALKQEGFGEILPGAQAFVIDEAHQLPELAANFFGEGFGMRPLQELARDCLTESKDAAGALSALQPPVRALEQALR